MIKVMIADDQYIVREGIKRILSLSDEISVICEAENGFKVLENLSKYQIDILLLDINMPKMDGLETAKRVKMDFPKVKIIVLTTYSEDKYIFKGIQMGISGYLLKDSEIEEINTCIKKVYEEKIVFDSAIMSVLVDAINSDRVKEYNQDLSILTAREKEIADLIAGGKSNIEIAEELYITEGTVKNMVSKMLKKLNIKRRTQLINILNRQQK